MGLCNKLLTILGAISLGVVAFPDVIIYAAFTGVGFVLIPALMGVLPLATVLIVARGIQLGPLNAILPRSRGLLNFFAGICIALGIFAIIPALSNWRTIARVDALVADDVDQLQLPLPHGAIAVRMDRVAKECSDLCQRLLLSGAASQVLLQQIQSHESAPDPESEVMAYRMKKRDTCPRARMSNVERVRGLGATGAVDKTTPLVPSDATPMLTQIAPGNCLIEEKAVLGTADTFITSVRMSYKTQTTDQGFSLFGKLILSDRLSVHQRTGDDLTETYRWTGVKADVMTDRLALPRLNFGSGMSGTAGFNRTEVRRNIDEGQYDGADLAGLLTQKLGLTLNAAADALPAAARDTIAQVLDSPSPFSRLHERLITEYLARFAGRNSLDPADHAMFLKLVRDPRVVLTPKAAIALLPAGRPDNASMTGFAQAVMHRLQRTKTGDDQFGFAGTILARLPTDMLAPYLPQMIAWSNNRKARWNLEEVMVRFADFGATGSERLLYLVGDSGYEGIHGKALTKREPYISGLRGLCRMGAEASAHGPALLALANDGRIYFDDGTNGFLAVRTLIRLGVAEAEVRRLAARADFPIEISRMDREIGDARREPDCRF